MAVSVTPVPRAARRTGSAIVTALTIVLVASCGGGGGGGQGTSAPTARPAPRTPTTRADRTAWEQVLDGIAEDGTVDRETALAAFSLAVADLPGSSVPPGDPGPMPDGSGAVAWVLREFDTLSPEQRQAVGNALGAGADPDDQEPTSSLRAPGFDADVRLAVSGSPARGCYGQPVVTQDSPGSDKFRALVDEMVDRVGRRLSITMDLETFVVVEERAAAKDKSDAFTWADRSDCSQNEAETCTIHFNPRAATATTEELRAIVAHEVMHCYVFAHLGVQAYNLPPWIGEGIPAWVGETIANGSTVSARWWLRYLTNPAKGLFAREYDAIGFYAHLDETGTDPWATVVPMLDAFANEAAFQASVGSGNDGFLDSWPSGFAREPSRGRAWDTKMPGITGDKAPLQTRAIANGQSLTESSPPAANRVIGLAIDADVLVVKSDSNGLLAGGKRQVAIRSAGNLCLREGGCACPAGTEGPDEQITDFESPERLAVTGGLSQGEVTLTAISLEEWCGPKIDPCLVGSWVSTRIEITDETTGAPVTELGGGDGVRMTISRDGTVSIDHGGMQPIRSNVSGIVMQTVISGVSRATIAAKNGQLTVESNDFETSAQAQVRIGALSGRSLPGTPVLATGTYQCTASTLSLSNDYPLGRVNSEWEKA